MPYSTLHQVMPVRPASWWPRDTCPYPDVLCAHWQVRMRVLVRRAIRQCPRHEAELDYRMDAVRNVMLQAAMQQLGFM